MMQQFKLKNCRIDSFTENYLTQIFFFSFIFHCSLPSPFPPISLFNQLITLLLIHLHFSLPSTLSPLPPPPPFSVSCERAMPDQFGRRLLCRRSQSQPCLPSLTDSSPQEGHSGKGGEGGETWFRLPAGSSGSPPETEPPLQRWPGGSRQVRERDLH